MNTSMGDARASKKLKGIAAVAVAGGLILGAGAAGAQYGFRQRGGNYSHAQIRCPGGLTSLEHVFDESNSFFDGDPETHINIATTIAADGYLVEALEMGTHTGTHLDSPGHFIEGGRTVDQLSPEDMILPIYVIDVRARIAEAIANGDPVDFELEKADIKAYEDDHGRIKRRSLVVIQTGFETVFGTPAFEDPAPGFSGEAVQWMVNKRKIGGVGSDTFGPDATSDPDYDATYTILLNDRIAVPGLTNLDSLAIKGDIVMLSPVRLGAGSGFQVNPVACHGNDAGHDVVDGDFDDDSDD